MGYYDVYFVTEDRGLKVMRKLDGKCIFFQNGECEVYERRPNRCKFYPMTFDGDRKCATVQEDCRFKTQYEVTHSGSQRMMAYIDRLKHEFDLRNGNKDDAYKLHKH
jgi:Fe-S-cluster containining protein